jgi:hypothetical protein
MLSKAQASASNVPLVASDALPKPSQSSQPGAAAPRQPPVAPQRSAPDTPPDTPPEPPTPARMPRTPPEDLGGMDETEEWDPASPGALEALKAQVLAVAGLELAEVRLLPSPSSTAKPGERSSHPCAPGRRPDAVRVLATRRQGV